MIPVDQIIFGSVVDFKGVNLKNKQDRFSVIEGARYFAGYDGYVKTYENSDISTIDINPIKLTEEVLKCIIGFSEINDPQSYVKWFNLPGVKLTKNENEGFFNLYVNYGESGGCGLVTKNNKLNYLHELQFLYKGVMGELFSIDMNQLKKIKN